MRAGTLPPSLPNELPHHPPPSPPSFPLGTPFSPPSCPPPFPPRAKAMGMLDVALERANLVPPPPPPPEGAFMKAWAYGLWGALGEIGSATEELYSEDNQNYAVTNITRFNWYPVLLFVTTFVLTVFLVNLMIARMTATYEKIDSNARYYRSQLKLELVQEFKDGRGAPSPVNLWVAMLNLLSMCFSFRRTRGLTEGKALPGYRVYMNKTATDSVGSRERHYRAIFNRRWALEEASKQERKVKELHELVPILQRLDSRTEQLAKEMDRVKLVQERLLAKADLNVSGIADLTTRAGSMLSSGGAHGLGMKTFSPFPYASSSTYYPTPQSSYFDARVHAPPSVKDAQRSYFDARMHAPPSVKDALNQRMAKLQALSDGDSTWL